MCIAKGVKKLKPGHAGVLDFETGHFKVWKYWDLPSLSASHEKKIDGYELAEQAWSLLLDSVHLRLRSDVPTGIFLSGGLDSSLVTAAACHVSNDPVKTFTIGVPGSYMDETSHALKISDAFSTNHHILEIERPSLDILDELEPFIDEPIADSSILPSFLISRLTRRHVTVALGGDGGDELFGGYQHYQNVYRDTKFLKFIPSIVFQSLASLASTLPAGIKGRNRLTSLSHGPSYSTIWGTPYFDIALRKKVLSKDMLSALGNDIAAPEIGCMNLLKNIKGSHEVVDNLTRLDFQHLLPDDYLVKVDRASMANSLEVRTPFLDHRLIEFAYSKIPSIWKCNFNERRRVQNLMAKKHLPKAFELNRKQGFSVPMDQWIRHTNKDMLMDQIPNNILNIDYINELYRGHAKGRTNGARLFALIMLSKSSIF